MRASRPAIASIVSHTLRQMQPHWRDCLRVFPALTDPTFVNDTIRREHSPPDLP